MKKGSKFGRWVVVDDDTIKDHKYVKKVLCFDETTNVLKYVSVSNLKNGLSKGSKQPGNLGHSTRTEKNKELELKKNIHPWNIGLKKYRVVYKDNGKTKTLGYYYSEQEAKEAAETV